MMMLPGRRQTVLMLPAWLQVEMSLHHCGLYKSAMMAVVLMALKARIHVWTPKMKLVLTGTKVGGQS